MKLIIPYRLKSSRFENKYISKFLGLSLIEHSLKLCEGLGYDVILTSPKVDYLTEISKLNEKYNFTFIPTSDDCKSGTDRVIDISREINDDYYALIPADEPLIDRNELKNLLSKNDFEDFNTCYTDFYCEDDCISNLSSKVVYDWKKYLLFQSRNIIPFTKSGNYDYKNCKKHIGIKIFSRYGLNRLYILKERKTKLDTIEGLEELRYLELGFRVKLYKINHIGFGIDIPEQIKNLEERFYANTNNQRS